MDVKSILPVLVQISLALILASYGLKSQWTDLIAVMRQPARLVRGFIAINLIVPGVAIACMLVLPVEPILKAGLLAMAIAPLAALVPGKMLKAGADTTHVIGLYVALLILSILTVPASLAVIRLLTTSEATIPVGHVVRQVLLAGLLPLVAGLTIGTVIPRYAPQLAAAANLIGTLILLPLFGLVVVHFRSDLMALLGDGMLFAIILTVVTGLAAGHWLGGPRLSDRRALAAAAATRHPGIAGLIIGHNFDDSRAMLVVILFLVTGLLLSAIYDRWAIRGHEKAKRWVATH